MARPAVRVPVFTAEAWTPLRVELFRSLWIATSIAQIGIWAREAGGPWLMELMTNHWPNQAAMVTKVTLYSNLPICLFSVFAGALADVLDRRRLLIFTNAWMLVVSVVLGVLTCFHFISPLGLLGLTFLLGTGTAAMGPALQALLPELVPVKDMALAINLNSVALNVARAVGPATFILVINFLPGYLGVGVSFILSGVSFLWAVWVLATWKRPPQKAGLHGEQMWGAIRSGFQYTVHSPANRAILLRVFTFIVPALVMWAQVPTIATKQLGMGERSYAVLFAFVGIGAILGVILMPGLHRRKGIDFVVNVCTLLFAGGLMLLSFVHVMWLALPIMAFLGVNWVIIPTNFNTATQKSVPLWVKGRAISFYLTVLFGSFAVGAKIWGLVTVHTNISTSLFFGGLSMAVLLVLAYWFPLTLNEGLDLATFAKAGGPEAPAGLPDSSILPYAAPEDAPDMRPVEVSIEYDVSAANEHEFPHLMRRVGQARRRSGAWRWRLERVTPESDDGEIVVYRERFRFASRAEFGRQPARMTRADAEQLQKVRSLLAENGTAPAVRTRTLFGDDASAIPHPLAERSRIARARLGSHLAASIDRAFDELGNALDRSEALRRREREAKAMRLRIAITMEREKPGV